MLLREIFSDSILIILTYYLGMMMWISAVYMFRDTFKLLKNILLEYKYDNELEKEITPVVREMYQQMTKNMYIMLFINILASIFCGLYLAILGIKAFTLVSIPLIFLLTALVVLMGIFNNVTNKDVHKTKTLLG